MVIPSKIRIGGQDIDVELAERLPGDKLGTVCLAEGKLLVARNFSDKKQSDASMQNTFVHEVVHAILDTMGENELSGNEKFVSTFSSFLVDVVEEIVKADREL